MAQRANISPTWYTWLEQGRGGAPSADVLDRIASALMLTEVEREHVFLLGLGRPPEVRYRKNDSVTPRLQRVLDALNPTPVLIRTATWDVVAWNRAATVMLVDYGLLPPEQRSILRFIFLDSRARATHYDWESAARFALGAFRADAARAGVAAEVGALVEELCRRSPEFRAMWRDNDVHGARGEAIKRIRHPVLGTISFDIWPWWMAVRTSAWWFTTRPHLKMSNESRRCLKRRHPQADIIFRVADRAEARRVPGIKHTKKPSEQRAFCFPDVANCLERDIVIIELVVHIRRRRGWAL